MPRSPDEAMERLLDMIVSAHDRIEHLAARPGIPGRDGVGFDDVEEKFEDGGRVLVKQYFCAGRMVKENRIKTPFPVHRGVYQAGRKYETGDEVIFGGTTFRALCETEKKPETEDWFMVAKRGRDGERGKSSPPPSGPVKIGGK